MTRFWITLDEGINLVLKTLEFMQGGEIFVPKIPSMKLLDLAEAVAPDCRIEIVGIRPGEKLHECLIGEEDARFTLEYDGFYVINPMIRNWVWDPERQNGGKPVPEGFRYSSDGNDRWLNRNQLLEILSKYKLVGGEMVALDQLVENAQWSLEQGR